MKVEFDIKHCSECPFGKVVGPYWNPDFDEDNYDVHCSKLEKKVHKEWAWNEIAAKNSKHTGMDKPPRECPFNTKTQ